MPQPPPQQYPQQRLQLAGPPQPQHWQQHAPGQLPQWQGPPQQRQWQGPPQQRNQAPPPQQAQQWQAARPLGQGVQSAGQVPPEQQADEGDVMADVAPGAFVMARSKQVWRTGGGMGSGGQDAARLAAVVRALQGSPEPEQQQEQPGQQPAVQQAAQQRPNMAPPPSDQQQVQPAEQPEQGAAQQAEQAALWPDEGDVMADVQPGQFVSAGGKQSWRVGTGGGGLGELILPCWPAGFWREQIMLVLLYILGFSICAGQTGQGHLLNRPVNWFCTTPLQMQPSWQL